MIYDELIQEVCERLNLTSDEAKSRVGRELNSRYRSLTSSLGLEATRRASVSKVASIGNQTITFTGVEKLIVVYTQTGSGATITNTVLTAISSDEMLKEPILTDNIPTKYSVTRYYPTSVDIKVNCLPSGLGFTLYADADVTVTTLSGSTQPQFPESFHDTLVYGVMAEEYRKMEKTQLAQAAEADYERRLSDLRMWIAKNAWLDVYQGKDSSRNWWERQWGVTS